MARSVRWVDSAVVRVFELSSTFVRFRSSGSRTFCGMLLFVSFYSGTFGGDGCIGQWSSPSAERQL